MKRIIIGAILPVILFAVFATVYYLFDPVAGLKNYQSMENINPAFLGKLYYLLKYFLVAMALGVTLVGVQSIISSFVMEKVINPRVHNHIIVVFLAAVLGVLSGMLGAIVMSGFTIAYFALLGAVIGAITGMVLRWLFVKKDC